MLEVEPKMFNTVNMQGSINLLPQEYRTKPRKSWTKHSLYAFVAIIPTVLSLYLFLAKPNTPISPLANADQPDLVRQSLSEETQSLAFYISAAQKYLDQARDVSKETAIAQSSKDKQKIISLLNESLRSANNAVRHYPQEPISYSQRAKTLRALAVIDPSVNSQAESDEQIAQALGSDGTTPKINPEDLILYQPIQEASLADNITIALPEDEKVADIETEEDRNATRGATVLRAGETLVTVSSDFVKDENLIYFTPEGDTQNNIISLSSKSEKSKSFTLKISSPLPYDLPITWWIVD